MSRPAVQIGALLWGLALLACSPGSGYQVSTGGTSGGQTSGGTGGSGTTGVPPECANDAQCAGKQSDAGVPRSHCSAAGRCVECLSNTDCSNQGHCDLNYGICLPSCVTNPSLCSSAQVCDTQTGGCVGCLGDGDCHQAAYPHCALSGPRLNECVQCLASSDCPYSRAGCNTQSGSCGSCSSGGDCPAGLSCNGSSCNCTLGEDAGCGGDAPVCVDGVGGGTNLFCGCNDSTQCPGGEVCDTLHHGNGACVTACTAQSCAQSANTPYCAPSGLCASCLDDGACVDAGIGGEALPYCAGAGYCGACKDDSHCGDNAGLPHCNPYLAECVQCNDFTQCPANEPGCDSRSHRCLLCHRDVDCNQDAGFNCDLATNLCRASCASLSCPETQPYCNNAVALCMQCRSDADCVPDAGPRPADAGPPPDGGDAGPTPLCNPLGFCGQLGVN